MPESKFEMDGYLRGRIIKCVETASGGSLDSEELAALKGALDAEFGKERHIGWHVDDVLEVLPDLTERQAHNVLVEMIHKHDASLGISWDTIECYEDAAGENDEEVE